MYIWMFWCITVYIIYIIGLMWILLSHVRLIAFEEAIDFGQSMHDPLPPVLILDNLSTILNF